MHTNNNNVDTTLSLFEEARNFLSNTLQFYNMQEDIRFYQENKKTLVSPDIFTVTDRLGKTVSRYWVAIPIYNLFISAVKFIEPNKSETKYSKHRHLSGLNVYTNDLEEFNKAIPYLVVIKTLVDNRIDATSDIVLDWLAINYGVNPTMIKVVKDCFNNLLSQQR